MSGLDSMDGLGGGGYNIRFRHATGDFGPYTFPKSCTVLTLKEKLLEEWPKEPLLQGRPKNNNNNNNAVAGATKKTTTTTTTTTTKQHQESKSQHPIPRDPSELRIIFAGRMLEERKLVKELQHSMGNPQGARVVTMHVVVRHPADEKGGASGGRGKDVRVRTCCSVQ